MEDGCGCRSGLRRVGAWGSPLMKLLGFDHLNVKIIYVKTTTEIDKAVLRIECRNLGTMPDKLKTACDHATDGIGRSRLG